MFIVYYSVHIIFSLFYLFLLSCCKRVNLPGVALIKSILNKLEVGEEVVTLLGKSRLMASRPTTEAS